VTRALGTLLALALLVPAGSLAVPRPPDPRLHPAETPALPSFVARVEPAMVGLRARAPAEAPSSARVGARRFASGVVFDERGYAVSVAYALADATIIEATTRDNRTVPAELVALDFETGLGVVRLAGGGVWPTATLADSRNVPVGGVTGTVGVDEDNELVHVIGRLAAVRRFSAFWEYMLDRGLFVEPGSPAWGGSAIVDQRGVVVGFGSLRLGEPPHVNLAIPAEKFLAVKDELVDAGRVESRPPRPWLGLYTTPVEGGVVVDGFAVNGPARTAGLRKGDRIVRVNGIAVATQEEFYRQLWRGQAGDVVRLAVERGDRVHVVAVPSMDRAALAFPPPLPTR
jgi:S1-C subfamily serine protease